MQAGAILCYLPSVYAFKEWFPMFQTINNTTYQFYTTSRNILSESYISSGVPIRFSGAAILSV